MQLKPPDRMIRIIRSDDSGAVLVGPRQIYIIPTRYGIIFGLLLLLLLFGSINYANNPAFLLTFLLVGLGVVATLHTWRNLVGLQLMPGRAEPVFAGQDAHFGIQLLNRRESERPGIRLQLSDSDRRPVSTDVCTRSGSLLHFHVPTTHRGRVPLDRFIVFTNFPLGLLKAWSYVEMDISCLVYPVPAPQRPPSGGPDYTPSSKGDKGVGVDDFVGIRPYRSGDSPKHINWKAMAGGRGLQTKQFGGDRADRLWLDWDSMPGADTETRLSRLCRGILDACDKEQEFGLRLPGTEIKPARGQSHRHACLAALALFEEPA